MASLTLGSKPVWRRFDCRTRVLNLAVWLAVFAVVGLCAWQVHRNTMWIFVLDAHTQGADLLQRMFPPNFGYMPRLWRPLWDTINIATLGTLLALVAATPVAFLAAKTTSPHSALRGLALLVIVSTRSINSLIWAMIFVSILGPGILAGVCAIAVRSIGFVAKLLYEALEEVDQSQIEAIRATGAGGGQILLYGYMPQIMPAFAGISVFRWDINIRESTVLGYVGAGGIGLQINAMVNALQWRNASMIFVCILLLVLASELVSARVRKRFI